jgi:hypothetical protein
VSRGELLDQRHLLSEPAGSKSGMVSITDSASSKAQVVELSGKGT